MNAAVLTTKRLQLRRFTAADLTALYELLCDTEVNTFLPWFPVRNLAEAQQFYEARLKPERYCFAICLKEDGRPIGYVHMAEDDSHDFGYALRREFWRRGITTEACKAVIELLSKEGVPYITATHDRNNVRSGAVMKRLGMQYCYSYQEQWQPKDIPVIFRMYQLDLDGQNGRAYQKYWDAFPVHFIETDV